MTDQPDLGSVSFRDPAGRVRQHGGEILRDVLQSGRIGYDRLMRSGLYDRLVERGLLVSHEEVEGAGMSPDTWRVLRPERVPFISYGHEWCFSQLRDAALATLQIQDAALEAGLTLKDAIPENIQFVRGRALLIDTLSFEPAGPVWTAYYQFCRRFLAPLALASYYGPEFLRSLAVERDGISLPFVSAVLPKRTWLRPGLALHLHLHARADRRAWRAASERDRGDGKVARDEPDADVAAGALSRQRALVGSLRRLVERLRWRVPRTEWTEYEDRQPTYSPEAWMSRESLVKRILEVRRPAVVWDLGAALGHASRLAASAGALTIALDSDPACVELMWQRIRRDGESSVLPLLQDLLRPTPRLGWGEQELLSLSDRGPADLLMCLGLFHHLNVRGGVPAELVFDYFAKLGRAALVEFIPPADPIVAGWCRTFGRSPLAEDSFRAAAERHYGAIERFPITASGRSLYLCQRRRLPG